MTHFPSLSLFRSRTLKPSRSGPSKPTLGLLILVCLLGWIPIWSQQVYVTDTNVTDTSPGVAVISASTNTLVATVPMGGETFGVAITPNGQFAYVTGIESTDVAVINTSTNTIVATVAVGDNPSGLAITPNGQFAYVTVGAPSSVSVINTSTNTVVANVPMIVGANPTAVAVTPNGQFVYVSNTYAGTVAVIATSTNTIVATISPFIEPEGLAITPNGKFVYVSNFFGDTVSVIDTSSNTVVSTIPIIGEQPNGVAITPNGQFAYVTNFTTPNVTVIDISSNTVLTSIPVATASTGVAITPNGQFAYVAGWGFGTVPVIDTSTNTVVSTVTVGGLPNGIAITPALPFSAFSAFLAIDTGGHPGFLMTSTFTLGSGSSGLQPANEAMTLEIANYTLNLPAGSFQPLWNGPDAPYVYKGTVNGASLVLGIIPLGGKRFAFEAAGSPVTFPGITNPVAISLFFGDDSGTTSAKALIAP